MPKRSSAPPPALRTQPARAGKITEYTKEHLGEDKDGPREKRWRYAGFEPGVAGLIVLALHGVEREMQGIDGTRKASGVGAGWAGRTSSCGKTGPVLLRIYPG